MKPELYFCEHFKCSTCVEKASQTFKYVEVKQGEKHVVEMIEDYSLIFILSGEARVTCNKFVDASFKAGDIVLCPMNSDCAWESVTDVKSIVLGGKLELPPCDVKGISERADIWFNAIQTFEPLPIKPRLNQFLESIKQYLDDGILCPYLHKSKMLELSMIFRAYYSPQELICFFFPAIRNTHEFENFVMENYLQMKGVKEFVDLSGMNLSAFNRKFKAHFKQSPYQWLIKQKSKHIYYELSATDKSFATIAKDFRFVDASHFNRYCKTMFGASPSKIRASLMNSNNENLMTG